MNVTADQAAQRKRTVVFDFDGTITRFDSSSHAVRELILANPLRTLLAVSLLPVCLPFFLFKRTEEKAGSVFVWIASMFRGPDGWLNAVQKIAGQSVSEARMNWAVIDRLRKHVLNGDRVFIVTGSAATVARSICDALSVDVPIIGSKLRPFLGGYVSRIHCIGPRKVERLLELHQLRTWDIVYSDSYRDIPLMKNSREVVLVNPGKFTLSRVRTALPKSVSLEILRS